MRPRGSWQPRRARPGRRGRSRSGSPRVDYHPPMDLSVVLIPVGKVEPAEVEAVAARVAKVLNHAVETRAAIPAPKAGDDPTRGQHLAAPFLAALKAALPRTGPAGTTAPDAAI